MSRYVCQICGFVYDEAKGMPDKGIAPGTTFDQLPDTWVCPFCGAPKSQFKKEEPAPAAAPAPKREESGAPQTAEPGDGLRPMSDAVLAAVLSNLARGCEKQYKAAESALYQELADFYTKRAATNEKTDFDALIAGMNEDLSNVYPQASATAAQTGDRGAKRVLVWSEKVTRMAASILSRYESEGGAFLENTKVWVCDICGFIYIGEVPPAVCPICKVPGFKILEVART